MALKPTHLAVGHVSKLHGTRGEVLVWPLTDHPESVFAPGVVLRLAAAEGEVPDPDAPPLRVESVRPFRGGVLVGFAGVLTRNDAEPLKDRYLVLPVGQLAPREEDEFFYHELIGLGVRTVEGRELGAVEEVYELEPSHMLQVRGEGRTFLVPLSKRIVREVNLEEGWILIDPPEGLLDL